MATDQLEQQWGRLLHVKTTGRDDSNADLFKYPYEPTPYCVLERLASHGLVRKGNTLLDYGCGKGRVGFFMSHQTRCRSIGVECSEWTYRAAERNLETAVSRRRVALEMANAEDFAVAPEVDRCFFFNPFSEKTLRKVLANILASWYGAPREILLMFYYPSDEYLSVLMGQPELEPVGEIDCRDLFAGEDPRERIALFRLA